MKKTYLGASVWIANLLLLAGGVALAVGAVQAEPRVPGLPAKVKIEPTDWQTTAARSAAPVLAPGPLSPRERPRETVEAGATKSRKVDELTNEELSALLKARIRSDYRLELISYSNIPGKASIAFVMAGNVRLQLFEGTSLGTNSTASGDSPGPAVSSHITVRSIFREGIVLRARSGIRPSLTVDVTLELPPTAKLPDYRWFNGGEYGAGLTVGEPEKASPQWPTESKYDADADEWTLGRDDFEALGRDLARYTRVIMAEDGRAIGVQISEDLPAESPVGKLGGRPGDMLKSINRIPVRSMSDVRRLVRREYDAGTREFVLEIERDGVSEQRTFRAPG